MGFKGSLSVSFPASSEDELSVPVEDAEGNCRDSLEALAQDLDDMECFFAHANPGYETFGNAVLVGKRLKVIHCDSIHLEGGSVISLGPGKTKHIGRGCLSDAPMQLSKAGG